MVKHGSTSAKLALLLLGLLLLGVTLVVGGSAWKLRELLLAQEHQVYNMVSGDIVAKLESELKGNADLHTSKIAQSMIDRYFNQIAPIKRISIFDLQGRIIFDTNRSLIATTVSKNWLDKSLQQSARLWSADFQMLRAADTPIRSQTGQTVAVLVLMAEDVRTMGVGFQIARNFSISSVAVLLLACVLCILLGVWGAKKMTKILQPAADDLYCLAYTPMAIAEEPRLYAADASDFTRPVAMLLHDLEQAKINIQHILAAK